MGCLIIFSYILFGHLLRTPLDIFAVLKWTVTNDLVNYATIGYYFLILLTFYFQWETLRGWGWFVLVLWNHLLGCGCRSLLHLYVLFDEPSYELWSLLARAFLVDHPYGIRVCKSLFLLARISSNIPIKSLIIIKLLLVVSIYCLILILTLRVKVVLWPFKWSLPHVVPRFITIISIYLTRLVGR